MKIAQLFILILAFLIIKPVNAGVLIEPVVGYSAGSVGEDKDKATGPSIGGRLGYQNFGFQLGLDYLRTNFNVDENDFKDDAITNEFAGFVGFEFPILFRVYAGYIFSATTESKFQVGAQEVDYETKDGSGLKFGLGFTPIPFVDINFEYRAVEYADTKKGSVKTEDDFDNKAYMISLSLPFVI